MSIVIRLAFSLTVDRPSESVHRSIGSCGRMILQGITSKRGHGKRIYAKAATQSARNNYRPCPHIHMSIYLDRHSRQSCPLALTARVFSIPSSASNSRRSLARFLLINLRIHLPPLRTSFSFFDSPPLDEQRDEEGEAMRVLESEVEVEVEAWRG